MIVEQKANAKCPECGEEIDYLDVHSVKEIYHRFSHNGYEEVDKEDMKDIGFYCPECETLVAARETGARKILLLKKEKTSLF